MSETPKLSTPELDAPIYGTVDAALEEAAIKETLGSLPGGDPRDALHAELNSPAALAEEKYLTDFSTAHVPAEQRARDSAYEDTLQTSLADPQRLTQGNSGWGEAHRIATKAAEQAGAAHRAQREREATFSESIVHDRWGDIVTVLDEARRAAEAADRARPGDERNWIEFDTYFKNLRSTERAAYTAHAGTSETKPPTPDSPKPNPAAPDSTPEQSEPTAVTPATPKVPEMPPADNSTTQEIPVIRDPNTTRELPVVTPRPLDPRMMRPDGRDPRVHGHLTWEGRELARAQARDRGEEVPPAEGLLGPAYFEKMQDLPPNGTALLHQLAIFNQYTARGARPSKEVQEKVDQLRTELDASHNGLGQQLFDVYAAGGKFSSETGSTLMTEDGAKLIDLVHQYKVGKKKNSVRHQIAKLWAKINEEETAVPQNWYMNPDGTISPVEGYMRKKGDWLMDRHSGTVYKKEFGTFAKREGAILSGEMMQPVGRAARIRHAIGQRAVTAATAAGRGITTAGRATGRGTARARHAMDFTPLFRKDVDTSRTGELYGNREEGDWLIPPREPEQRPKRQPLRQRISGSLGKIARRLSTNPTPETRPPGVDIRGEGLPSRQLETPEDFAAFERAQREARN